MQTQRRNGEEIKRGNRCGATGDPRAFRHGHFEFHHADPSLITLPGTGKTDGDGSWEQRAKYARVRACTVPKTCETQKMFEGDETSGMDWDPDVRCSLPEAHLLLISCRPLFPMASTWTQTSPRWSLGR